MFSITHTGSDQITVDAASASTPFSGYSLNNSTVVVGGVPYGGDGPLTITLHNVDGIDGTISDDAPTTQTAGIVGHGSYDPATKDYTFTENVTEGGTGYIPRNIANNILDRLVYHAPDTSTDIHVSATVSYTGGVPSSTEIGPDHTYPTEVTQTVTYPIPLDIAVNVPAPQPAPVAEDPTPVAANPTPVATPVPDPTPAPVAPAPTPAANFAVMDGTTSQGSAMAGDAYTGPVGGLLRQLIILTPHNLAVAAAVPNSFIHTGSGDDAIDVSAVSGNNVLDGGTGSNFLVGGAGNDTFFLDARNASASTWSTVGNFHSGDAATLWGLTPQDFATSWVDGQGATGHQGLTLHATGNAGQPEASLTLAGYSTADLSNGRLAMVFGHNDGGDYLYIHAA